MKASRMLLWARLQAGLTQRELAARGKTAQSTISRIESGQMDPSVGTLGRLLRACGYDLWVEPRLGQGVDTTQLRERLALSPAERLDRLAREARWLAVIRGARKVPPRSG